MERFFRIRLPLCSVFIIRLPRRIIQLCVAGAQIPNRDGDKTHRSFMVWGGALRAKALTNSTWRQCSRKRCGWPTTPPLCNLVRAKRCATGTKSLSIFLPDFASIFCCLLHLHSSIPLYYEHRRPLASNTGHDVRCLSPPQFSRWILSRTLQPGTWVQEMVHQTEHRKCSSRRGPVPARTSVTQPKGVKILSGRPRRTMGLFVCLSRPIPSLVQMSA